MSSWSRPARQYIADAVAGGAIRRQDHPSRRCTASWRRGCRCRSGLKNGTDGNIQVAVDGAAAAAAEQVFFGMDDMGRGTVVSTAGNRGLPRDPARRDRRTELRGRRRGRCRSQADRVPGCPLVVVIDCSHANSGKDHVRQASVAVEVAQPVRDGLPISGVDAGEASWSPVRRRPRRGRSPMDSRSPTSAHGLRTQPIWCCGSSQAATG